MTEKLTSCKMVRSVSPPESARESAPDTVLHNRSTLTTISDMDFANTTRKEFVEDNPNGPIHRRRRIIGGALAALIGGPALGPISLAAPAPTTGAPAPTRTIMVVGDSLSAGYGLRSGEEWPHLLHQRLTLKHPDYTVVNRAVSGETTAGALSRLTRDLAVGPAPAIVVLAIGANDGLRGLPLEQMRDNLLTMIRRSRQAKAQVVLVGERVPANYGPFANAFYQVYTDLAKAERLPFVPFLLEGVVEHNDWFQADNLHPLAVAQPVILDNIWRVLDPLLPRQAGVKP